MRNEVLHNSPDAVLAFVKEHCMEYLPRAPVPNLTTWTNTEGQAVWALSFHDFVLYPTRLLKKTIAGEKWICGWQVERVYCNDDGADSLPDMETESLATAVAYLYSEWLEGSMESTLKHSLDRDSLTA